MIKLGTVGTSSICNSFLDGAACTNLYELNAVYSRKFETGIAFAKKRGCDTVFTDLVAMAKSDLIDAVYIATPNSLHFSQSKIFLENGKHVICEKPITSNSSEYKTLMTLAENNGLIYMEAIIPRHIKTYKNIKYALQKIGKIKSADIRFIYRSIHMDDFLRGEHVNVFDMSLCGGTLMDSGVYCVYGAIDLFGMPNHITAQKILLSNGADGEGIATFYYDDFKATLTYSKMREGYSQSVIIGEKGILKFDMISQYAGVTLEIDGLKKLLQGPMSKADQMQGEAQRFAEYILFFGKNKADFVSASELCLNVHKCMDLIKKSAGLIYE